MDLWGPLVLLVMLPVIGAVQGGIALGAMYLMHTKMRDKLTETTYGRFDFDNFQKIAFQDLLVRLAIIFIGTTFVLHFLDYFLVGAEIRRYRGLVRCFLFILETGAITAGLSYMFRLDRLRLMVLAGVSAVVYLFFLWYLTRGAALLV